MDGWWMKSFTKDILKKEKILEKLLVLREIQGDDFEVNVKRFMMEFMILTSNDLQFAYS